MKIAIFGATGLVGGYACKVFEKSGWTVVKVANKSTNSDYQLDAADHLAVKEMIKKEKPDAVINAVKSSISTDASEIEKESTWQANVVASENLARLQREYNFNLVHISTDWVFEGKEGEVYAEDSIPYPVNFYSFSKAVAEERVRNIASRYVILRPTGLFGIDNRGANFFMRVKTAAEKGAKVAAPIDQFSQPIFASELAEVMKAVIEKNAQGIYNAVGPDYVSRFELGQLFCEVFGWDKNLITPSETGQRAIRVPRYLRVNISKLQREVKKLKTLREQITQLKGEIE